MHNFYDFIGENVKLIRLAAGYTQEGLARELDVSLSVISRLETGRTMVSIERMLEIAQILGVTPGDILNEPLPEPEE